MSEKIITVGWMNLDKDDTFGCSHMGHRIPVYSMRKWAENDRLIGHKPTRVKIIIDRV